MGPIQEFTDSFHRDSTRRTYQAILCSFFRCINDIPTRRGTRIDFSVYEPLAVTYLQEVRDGRKAVNDIKRFSNSLSSSAPMTAKKYPNVVMQWLEHHDIEIADKKRKEIKNRQRPARPVSLQEQHITIPMIQKILEFSLPQMRALIMVLESSGMRIGETLKLKVENIKMDETPARIHIPGEITKTGMPRNVFVSSECKPILEDWLRYREEYISKKKGSRDYRINDGTVFPFSTRAAIEMWTVSLQKAGLYKRDETTNRLTLHPHSLRKFYRRVLPTGSKNPKAIEMVEQLMGHAGYLQGVYHNVEIDELSAFYQDAEHSLFINRPIVIKDPEAEEAISRMRIENTALKSELERQKEEIKEFRTLMDLLSDPSTLGRLKDLLSK